MNQLKPLPEISEIQELVNKKKNELKEHRTLDSYLVYNLRESIAKLVGCNSKIELKASDIQFADVPPNMPFDISIQFRSLMKDMKSYMSSQQKEIISILEENKVKLGFSEISAKGPFINVNLNTANLCNIITCINNEKESYGYSNSYFGKNIAVDFSSPNMGKSLHVGHIGTTLLGQVMSNIYACFNYNVFKINHIGDWGTPVGLVKVAEEEFANDEEVVALKGDIANYYATLYAKISAAQKENPELRERAKDFFLKLEKGESEAKSFFERVWKESVDELNKTYSEFNIEYDFFFGESFYEDYLEKAIEDVKKSKIATEDGEALLIEFEDEGLGRVLVIKSDGSTTYLTRDIAALRKRNDLLNLDKTVYVVGSEQTLHFRQLFKIGNDLGYMPSENCVHIPIGLLTKNGKKISSRTGGALGFKELYQEVLNKSKERTLESLGEVKDEVEKTAKATSQAAMFYSIASITPGKNSEFDIDKITNTKGKSGPSIQYACVRANSILKKVGEPKLKLKDIDEEKLSQSLGKFRSLIITLANYPKVIESCISQNTAHLLTNYLDDLVSEFTSFIHEVRIKDAKEIQQSIYLALLKACSQVMENGLRLLNIKVPEQM